MAPNGRGAPVLGGLTCPDQGVVVSLYIGRLGWLCYTGCGASFHMRSGPYYYFWSRARPEIDHLSGLLRALPRSYRPRTAGPGPGLTSAYTVRQLTYCETFCKRATADGLNPLTMGQMPSDNSQKNSGMIAMPCHTEPASKTPNRRATAAPVTRGPPMSPSHSLSCH
jgi:hypothetical protein